MAKHDPKTHQQAAMYAGAEPEIRNAVGRTTCSFAFATADELQARLIREEMTLVNPEAKIEEERGLAVHILDNDVNPETLKNAPEKMYGYPVVYLKSNNEPEIG